VRHIERLGAELAYALRMRNERRSAYERADTEVRRIEAEILEASSNSLERDTASQPTVGDERPTETLEHDPCPGPAYCAWAGAAHVHDQNGGVYSLKIAGIPQNWSS